mmetsp:Transcript_8701/g.19957  ORF Transcript_8701/g.19957 Transcript_8701/m.19957 type:complete len:220 (+) Transcript_8701:1229-1888(+)
MRWTSCTRLSSSSLLALSSAGRRLQVTWGRGPTPSASASAGSSKTTSPPVPPAWPRTKSWSLKGRARRPPRVTAPEAALARRPAAPASLLTARLEEKGTRPRSLRKWSPRKCRRRRERRRERTRRRRRPRRRRRRKREGTSGAQTSSVRWKRPYWSSRRARSRPKRSGRQSQSLCQERATKSAFAGSRRSKRCSRRKAAVRAVTLCAKSRCKLFSVQKP